MMGIESHADGTERLLGGLSTAAHKIIRNDQQHRPCLGQIME